MKELKALISYYADDGFFRQNLEQNRLSLDEQKFFLYEWEMNLARATRQPAIRWEEITGLQIEHIWPETPPGINSWPEDLKKKHWDLVNKLGNLALVPSSWNPQVLSNKPMYEKMDEYLKSNLAMLRTSHSNRDFMRVAQLQRDNAEPSRVLEAVAVFVGNRTFQLVNWALDRWKVED